VIADVFNYAIAVIGFIQTVRRLFARKGFTASLNTVMTLNWARRRDQCGDRSMSALSNLP
jgi:hypothetical protein